VTGWADDGPAAPTDRVAERRAAEQGRESALLGIRAACAPARIRLDIAYDGTDFSGWAVQPGRRTVQGVLQDAITRIARVPVALTVAGRTDAGVHALGQVAHAEVPHVPELRRLNGVLPPDVRVTAVTLVPAEFDARFSALWRRYLYLIADGPVNPLRRRHVLAWPRSLDVEAMAQAAARLVGEHDFAAFCHYRAGATSIRTVQTFDVIRDGDEIACTVQADAFCHSMVRSLVGALIAVGEGRRDERWPAALLSRTDRAGDVAVAPPQGLTLVAVGYPPDDELSARAAETRRMRA
jgi:tRNA pseudouridine38-40 synthase